jgi:VWFA-related protein
MRRVLTLRLISALAVCCSTLLLVPVAARSQAAAPQNPSSTEAPTFKSRVNLVVVPVVVYDKKGQAVGNLKQQDFQIFDEGKPQQITSFNVQTNDGQPAKAHSNSVLGAALKSSVVGTAPGHYFAYLFDDLHLKTGDLQQVRAAAKKHLQTHMAADDRAAVFTTSGHISLAFTDDKSLLATAMDRITPHSLASGTENKCPYMSYYLAQRIVQEFGGSSVTPAWDGATEDAWSCMFQHQDHLQPQAREMALDAARREVQIGDANTNTTLLSLKNTVRRLAAMPGTRTLVLISPGFLTGESHLDQNEAISSALQSQIVINTLDAGGLYTGVGGASDENGPSTPTAEEMEGPIIRAGMQLQNDVMAELAEGTGGKFFRDSNDLSGAFDQLASPPRFIYMLAFRPEILKDNGRYHSLKVSLTEKRGYTIQARHGYYESSNVGDPKKMVTQELEQALFSRDEVHSLPVTLKAQYRKLDSDRIQLVVTTHIDTDGIHFRRVENSNNDNLTVICGLFDLNGNYVDAKKQEISLHLTDKTLQQLTAGMNVQTDFDVKSGAYFIRVVVRDSDDAIVSAVNGSASVP